MSEHEERVRQATKAVMAENSDALRRLAAPPGAAASGREDGRHEIERLTAALQRVVIEMSLLVANPSDPDFTPVTTNANPADVDCLTNAYEAARDALAGARAGSAVVRYNTLVDMVRGCLVEFFEEDDPRPLHERVVAAIQLAGLEISALRARSAPRPGGQAAGDELGTLPELQAFLDAQRQLCAAIESGGDTESEFAVYKAAGIALNAAVRSRTAASGDTGASHE